MVHWGSSSINPPTTRLATSSKAKHSNPWRNFPFSSGGPVEQDKLLFAGFRWGANGQLQCDLHLSVDQACEQIQLKNHAVRAYLGHSAWSDGQLDEELEKHAWFCRDAPARLTLETPPKKLWSTLMQDLSPYHHILSLTPNDPFLN